MSCHPEWSPLRAEPRVPYWRQGRAALQARVPRPPKICHPDRGLQPERRDLLFPYGAPSWRTARWPSAEWKGSVTRPGRWPEGQLYPCDCHPKRSPHSPLICHPERSPFRAESRDPYWRQGRAALRRRVPHSLQNCHSERSPHSLLNCHPERSPLRAESRDLLFPRRTKSEAVAKSSTDDNRVPRNRAPHCAPGLRVMGWAAGRNRNSPAWQSQAECRVRRLKRPDSLQQGHTLMARVPRVSRFSRPGVGQLPPEIASAGKLLTTFIVPRLTVMTWPTRRTMYSGSSARLGSFTMPLRLSVETWY